MDIPAHKLFQTELQQLQRLYLTAKYSFDKSASLVTEENQNVTLTSPVETETVAGEMFLLARNGHALVRELKEGAPKYLRELLFVRIISALEVFLVDLVADLFAATKAPFKTDSKVEFTQGELLTYSNTSEIFRKIIAAECRSLQDGGFKKIVRYYKTRFSISIENFTPGISALEEFHERRHLLVHRLGKVDQRYAKKYQTTGPVSVSDNELTNIFSNLSKLGDAIIEKLEEKFKKELQTYERSKVSLYEVKVKILGIDGKRFIKGLYPFHCEGNAYLLKQILHEIKSEDSETFILILRGNSNIIQSYIKNLRAAERLKWLQIILKKSPGRSSLLTSSETKEVTKLFIDYGYKKGISRKIGEELGLDKREVFLAIQQIFSERNNSFYQMKKKRKASSDN